MYEIVLNVPYPLPSKIILVDDIFTQGITQTNINSILKKEGVNDIQYICLGRTDSEYYY